MTCAHILGYPLLLVSALELFLGFLLLRQNPRNSPVNRSIAAFSFFAAAFSLTAAILYIRRSMGLDYNLFARANWIGWLTIAAAFPSVFYLRDERSRAARAAGLILYPFWTSVLCLALFTDLVVTSDYQVFPYHNTPGPLEKPLRLVGAALIFWFMALLIRLRRQVSGVKRAQLNYFLYGTLIFGTGGAVVAGFMQLFGGLEPDPGLSAYFSLPWVLLTFYAITRHRLFDIRIVISRTLAILLLSVTISALQYYLFKHLEPVIGAPATIFVSVPIIGLLFFGTRLSKKVQTWITDLVVRDKYGYQKMLRASIQAMITILNRDELLEYIVESVRKGLQVENAGLYLADESGRYVMRHGFGVFRGMRGALALPDQAVERMQVTGQPIIRAELEAASPQGKADVLTAFVERIRAEIVLPLFYKGRLLGALTLGEKKAGEPFEDTDFGLLKALAGHAAIAIENSVLYEDACRVRASLRESEQMFRSLADTTAAGIFIHRGGRLLYANEAGAKMTGHTVAELLNMNFWDMVHPEHRDFVKSLGLARLQGALLPPQYELKLVTREGRTLWGYMTAGRIEFQGQPAVIGTLFDISERKRAEEMRDRLNEENVRQYKARIEDQQRHQAEKENILKDLHDGIGGLTTNISLLAELAQKSQSLDEVKRSLKTISELSRESLSEIRSFIQSLDTRELSWQSIAAELRQLGNTIVEGHGITFSITTDVNGVDANPGSTVSMNLFRIYKESLANIVKHSKATAVAVSFAVDTKMVVLNVRDNGEGFGEKRGLGRGLTNMKARAEQIGGRLTISPEPGNGTLINLEIPIP
jgi:PAS domain S-box-containing protein